MFCDITRKMLQFRLWGLVCTVIQFVDVLGNRSETHIKHTTVGPLSKFLNKFHQNDYSFTFERVEKVRDDRRYVEYECRTFKYNRTAPVVNASFFFHIDVGNHMEAIIQAYRFASNEYRQFPIHFQINFCAAIASNAGGVHKLIKMGNLFCPLVKGRKYYLYNFAPDSENFPPFIPNGQYMLEFQFMYHNIELFVSDGYGIVDRPIPIPKF